MHLKTSMQNIKVLNRNCKFENESYCTIKSKPKLNKYIIFLWRSSIVSLKFVYSLIQHQFQNVWNINSKIKTIRKQKLLH